MEVEAKEQKPTSVEVMRQAQSLSAHALVRQGLANGSFRYALMSFSKDP